MRASMRLPLAAGAAAAGLCVSLLLAEPPKQAKPSAYAPAKDLLAQVDALVEEMKFDLETEADFGDVQQQRIAKNANTVAAIVLVLGMHDEDNRLKAAAPQAIAAAKKLSGAAKQYGQAKAALAELERSFAASGAGEKLEWKPVADVAQLMKQVPIVSSNLRRGVEGRRFERLADRNAGYAAALAALAQASSFDRSYCADEADEAKWREHCAALRDAAAEAGKLARGANQKAAVEALERVEKSCKSCHAAFEVE